MAIFLRNSWNVPPVRWGSPADIQYAVKINAEKVYQKDPDNYSLVMPLFWGFPALDFSGNKNNAIRYGVTYKNQEAIFDGSNDYLDIPYRPSLNCDEITIEVRFAVDAGTLSSPKPLIQKAYTSHAAPYYQYSLLLTDVGDNLKTLRFAYTIGGVLNYFNYNDSPLEYEKQHNFTASYDQETARIYFDGIYAKSDPAPSGALSQYATDLEIGAYPNLAKTSSYCYGGKIYDVRISKKAFTEPDDARLFHELPYGLYQKVSRPFYLIPIVPTGWTGKINTVTDPSKIMGISVEDISKVNGIEGAV